MLFSPWVVQKGTILTNPGPLGENTVAHIMTQQNTRLCLASIRGTKTYKMRPNLMYMWRAMEAVRT